MRATELFDSYIFGGLSAEEKQEFENRIKTDSEFASAFDKHKTIN
jgi:anti-sigma-K factor RskA